VAATLLTADTSIIVPSLLAWHPLHEQAAELLQEIRKIPSHSLVESFSILTRLPVPRALDPALASQALHHNFPDEPFLLSAKGYAATIHRLADAGLSGGRIYDAVVAATAAEAGARLLTADRRALATYALAGAHFQLVS
jgi:predicted nucleic acid-binding protein